MTLSPTLRTSLRERYWLRNHLRRSCQHMTTTDHRRDRRRLRLDADAGSRPRGHVLRRTSSGSRPGPRWRRPGTPAMGAEFETGTVTIALIVTETARDRVQPAQRADRAARRRRRGLARRARVAWRHVPRRDDRQRRLPPGAVQGSRTGTCSTCITGTRRGREPGGRAAAPSPPLDPAAAERGEVGARARQADRPRGPLVPGPDAAARRAARRRAAAGADDDRCAALHRACSTRRSTSRRCRAGRRATS